MDEVELIGKAISEAKRAFYRVIEEHDRDPAYYVINVEVNVLDARFNESMYVLVEEVMRRDWDSKEDEFWDRY